MMSKS